MSIKAIGFSTHGAVDKLKLLQIDRPTAGADDLLVKVHAFAVNPVDDKVRSGVFGWLLTDPLKITGWDASGVVDSVGSNVSKFKPGDEVYFSGTLNRQGAYAEYVAVDHRLVALKPKSVDHVTASSFPLTALTAWEAYEDHFHLSIPSDANPQIAPKNASKTILITAGAGGVGSIAIQLAKYVFKLGRVIATAGRSESAQWARNMGADVILDRGKDWKSQLEASGIDGVDYILSCVEFDDTFGTFVSLLRPFGHITAILPNAAPLDTGSMFAKSQDLSFEFLGTRSIQGYERERHGENLRQLASFIDNGSIKSWLGITYDLVSEENIRAAHTLISSGKAIGKIAFQANFP